jgi:hypothetical protein
VVLGLKSFDLCFIFSFNVRLSSTIQSLQTGKLSKDKTYRKSMGLGQTKETEPSCLPRPMDLAREEEAIWLFTMVLGANIGKFRGNILSTLATGRIRRLLLPPGIALILSNHTFATPFFSPYEQVPVQGTK